MATEFWATNFGAKEVVSEEELVACLPVAGQTSRDAVRTVVKYMFWNNGEVTRAAYLHFAAVFAPYEGHVEKALESMFTFRKDLGAYTLHPWYHGNIKRAEGTALVTSGGEGCFLVRASSRPGNLALQFVARGTVKTTLLYNVGEAGFALTPRPGAADTVHASVAAFVQFATDSGKFAATVPSDLHNVSVEEAEKAAAERKTAAAAGGAGAHSNYAAFDLDGAGGDDDYAPLPDVVAGSSNYAAFDLDGVGGDVAAAAPPSSGDGSNYAAFDLDAMGDALPAAPAPAVATGTGNYGAFDPDILGDGGLDGGPGGGVAAAAAAAAPSNYGAFDPDAAGGDGDYAPIPSVTGTAPASNYAAFEG